MQREREQGVRGGRKEEERNNAEGQAEGERETDRERQRDRERTDNPKQAGRGSLS